MTRYNLNNITPFLAIHAGEYIKDELDARGMKQSELADVTGIKAPILSNIINGKRNVTAEQSILIGRAFGVSDDLFYNLQTKYDLDRARTSKRVVERTPEIYQWEILHRAACCVQ